MYSTTALGELTTTVQSLVNLPRHTLRVTGVAKEVALQVVGSSEFDSAEVATLVQGGVGRAMVRQGESGRSSSESEERSREHFFERLTVRVWLLGEREGEREAGNEGKGGACL